MQDAMPTADANEDDRGRLEPDLLFKRASDPALNRYFRRAARVLAVATRFPIAAVTFTDAQGRQQLIAQTGLDPLDRQLLLHHCEAASDRPGVHVVSGIRKAGSAMASDSPTFFASIVIQVHEGRGVMCVMGPVRSAWTTASQAAMIEVHAWLEDTLDALRSGRVDHLTGLANRRDIEEVLEQEWRRAVRESAPLSVLSIDIDHFKAYNDTYGHPRGDEALQAVARALRDALKRPGDAIGRMGGEEFVACLPATDRGGACAAGQSACYAIERLGIPHLGSPSGSLTVSVGSATAPNPAAIGGGLRALVAAADHALYEAKGGGRNRVVAIEISDPSTGEARDRARRAGNRPRTRS